MDTVGSRLSVHSREISESIPGNVTTFLVAVCHMFARLVSLECREALKNTMNRNS